MNKKELIFAVATQTGITQKDAGAVIDAMLDQIGAALARDDKVQLVGFGSFQAKRRQERIGRNPKTKEQMTIPASVVPAFTPGKELKERVAGR